MVVFIIRKSLLDKETQKLLPTTGMATNNSETRHLYLSSCIKRHKVPVHLQLKMNEAQTATLNY